MRFKLFSISETQPRRAHESRREMAGEDAGPTHYPQCVHSSITRTGGYYLTDLEEGETDDNIVTETLKCRGYLPETPFIAISKGHTGNEKTGNNPLILSLLEIADRPKSIHQVSM